MAECQNIEYKESWRDEYLKWLCGFANAQGEMAKAAKVSVPSIKRAVKILLESGKIVRKGGKRYGHWEVKKSLDDAENE